MRRIHLFEFEDLKRFPTFLRNYTTDFLQFNANLFNIYRNVIGVIQHALRRSGHHRIIDIASGGGGGLLGLGLKLKADNPALKITLTDYFPNLDAFQNIQQQHPDLFDFEAGSIDAMEIPKELKGFRTQLISFHHFKPNDAKQILQNAVDSNQPIAVLEFTQRTWTSLLIILTSPIAVWLSTPFIRPFRFKRLLFTYLIPIVPLIILWDGAVSVLRSYTTTELQDMIATLKDTDNFEWDIQIQKGNLFNLCPDILYLIGLPKEKNGSH